MASALSDRIRGWVVKRTNDHTGDVQKWADCPAEDDAAEAARKGNERHDGWTYSYHAVPL